MATTSSSASSLCIPIATGKKHKSAWKQWMTPIKVMESITKTLREDCDEDKDDDAKDGLPEFLKK